VKSLTMSISNEKDFHQEIMITPIFNIHASLHAFPTCTFYQSQSDLTNNRPY
jgi:hypothetical protein